MRVLVYGAGAIGSAVGALLAREHDVTLLCRPAHVQAINEQGLRITGTREMVVRNLKGVMDLEGVPTPELVLITTKAYNTAAAVEVLKDIVSDETVVVSMQNGLNNIDLVHRGYGGRALVALTSIGITLVGPGEVRWAGEGDTVVGSPAGKRDLAGRVASMFTAAGLSSRTSDDIVGEVWLKAIVNASINPLTALVRKENGAIQDTPELLALSRNVCLEATRAAEANGIPLPIDDPWSRVVEVIDKTRHNRSSMLQDMETGKRTEIDQITGALLVKGEGKGVAMPLNHALWALVRNASLGIGNH